MNHRYSFYLILLIAFLQFQIVFADCVGYTDSFDVRVLDAKYRALEGANVTVKYDRGTSFGTQYFVTAAKQTNSEGIVRMDIYNQGTTTRAIDCNIVVNGSMSGSVKSVTIVANQHGPIVDTVLGDVYPLYFYIRDQYAAPIPNATIVIGGRTAKTNQNGVVKHYFKTGTYDFFASYLDASQAGRIVVSDDVSYEVIFPKSKVSIDVTDDSGTPLNASLTIFNNTFDMVNGHFENENVYGTQVPYTIDYLGIVTSGTIIPTTEPIITIRHDIHPPSIGAVTSEFKNGRYRLNLEIIDPNLYSSGLDLQSIKLSYKVEPSDATAPWNYATIFSSGMRDKFAADLPPSLPSDSVIKFKIEAKDKSGNRAEREGSLTTIAGQTPQQNLTQNHTNSQQPPVQDQGIPLLYIIVGVILLLFGIYLVFRIKSKPTGGEQ
jgi:hypothetical protein